MTTSMALKRFFLLCAFAACLWLVSSCGRYIPNSERHYWRIQCTKTGRPYFDSTRIYLPPPDPFHSIEVEIVRGPSGERLYVNTLCYQICPPWEQFSETEVVFTCKNGKHVFIGQILQGGQRILLADEARHFLIRELLQNRCIEVQAGIFHTTITPSCFWKVYRKLS